MEDFNRKLVKEEIQCESEISRNRKDNNKAKQLKRREELKEMSKERREEMRGRQAGARGKLEPKKI